ncbi:MAG: hypothetical protein RLY43_1357 [Bacteroidota bacterium]|jgi:hypothetical protein
MKFKNLNTGHTIESTGKLIIEKVINDPESYKILEVSEEEQLIINSFKVLTPPVVNVENKILGIEDTEPQTAVLPKPKTLVKSGRKGNK